MVKNGELLVAVHFDIKLYQKSGFVMAMKLEALKSLCCLFPSEDVRVREDEYQKGSPFGKFETFWPLLKTTPNR